MKLEITDFIQIISNTTKDENDARTRIASFFYIDIKGKYPLVYFLLVAVYI